MHNLIVSLRCLFSEFCGNSYMILILVLLFSVKENKQSHFSWVFFFCIASANADLLFKPLRFGTVHREMEGKLHSARAISKRRKLSWPFLCVYAGGRATFFAKVLFIVREPFRDLDDFAGPSKLLWMARTTCFRQIAYTYA